MLEEGIVLGNEGGSSCFGNKALTISASTAADDVVIANDADDLNLGKKEIRSAQKETLLESFHTGSNLPPLHSSLHPPKDYLVGLSNALLELRRKNAAAESLVIGSENLEVTGKNHNKKDSSSSSSSSRMLCRNSFHQYSSHEAFQLLHEAIEKSRRLAGEYASSVNGHNSNTNNGMDQSLVALQKELLMSEMCQEDEEQLPNKKRLKTMSAERFNDKNVLTALFQALKDLPQQHLRNRRDNGDADGAIKTGDIKNSNNDEPPSINNVDSTAICVQPNSSSVELAKIEPATSSKATLICGTIRTFGGLYGKHSSSISLEAAEEEMEKGDAGGLLVEGRGVQDRQIKSKAMSADDIIMRHSSSSRLSATPSRSQTGLSRKRLPPELTSGVPGVLWHSRQHYWFAQWREDGKQKCKFFPVWKYGFDGAKREAIKFRLAVDEEKRRKRHQISQAVLLVQNGAAVAGGTSTSSNINNPSCSSSTSYAPNKKKQHDRKFATSSPKLSRKEPSSSVNVLDKSFLPLPTNHYHHPNSSTLQSWTKQLSQPQQSCPTEEEAKAAFALMSLARAIREDEHSGITRLGKAASG